MRSILLVSCLVLAACGGDGGSSASGSGPSDGVIGTRSVPGGMMTMQRTTPSTFRLTSDVAGVQTVDVLLGNDYGTALPVVMSASAEGGWAGTAPAGSHLLVRMTMGDGSLIESAPGDFDIR